MSEPKRLIDESVTDFERMLLDSGACEQPAPHLQRQMIAELGVSGAAATTALSLSTKWLLGLAGGALVAGALWFAEGSEPPVPDQPSPAPAPVAAPTPELSETSRSHALPATSEAPAVVETAPKSNLVPPRPTTAPEAAGSPQVSTLADEIALLERGRALLSAGDSASTLSVVRQYRQRFPAGALNQEATVIEVKALELRGEKGQAERLTDEFIEQHPDSAHRRRLEEGKAESAR